MDFVDYIETPVRRGVPRIFIMLGAALLAWIAILSLFGGVHAVFAQEAGGVVVTVPPTEVVFNWGDFLAIFLANIADPQSVAWTFVAGAIAFVVAQLPAPAKWFFNMFKVDQILQKALQAALNSTAGASAGQSLSLNVGSVVLAKAIQYAIDNGQKWLIDWMGGTAGIEQKLIARMDLAATVDGNKLVTQSRALGPLKITDPVPSITTTTVETK